MSSIGEVLENTEKVKTENGTFFIRRHDRVEQLEAENAKLRDAVMDMYAQIKQTCDICDGDFCFNYDEENDCCRFDTMVDELGIEASE